MLLTFSFLTGFGQSDEDAILEIREHRKKQEKEFRDPDTSPLEKRDRRHFAGLKYYPIDLSYRVKATFVKTENPVLFKMQTTTTRLPEYVKYGEVHFNLQGKDLVLEVYQSQDLKKRKEYEDYLFIPFTDETNGEETYDVGRYIDFRIPKGDEVIIDFNKCYNPSCSYSPKFSCPIPPVVNAVPLSVRAGEKRFKESH
ncbi:DUF1684 domain-containing protein [Chryseolinea lacunae]|uniref:DUF1684 domain-containing protein n=1 Tax=Chryseolinea lacunae TaxID=2801331 RepID=A0ABS1KVW4_9BACT|nr:DUF1684 domain-containing protein [Chryseolinea lacunae]MBL0743591.1 DUF1684 domain-containing protein [Chryseolinea lacunae]